MSGYIKIDRKILEWEWYRNINTKVLFLHLLLKANWKDSRFEGKLIPKGSFVSSISRLSAETDLTIREVRTAVEHLKTTGELTVTNHSKYSVFTVNNYCLYQTIDTQNDSQETGDRHASDFHTPCKRHPNDFLTTTIEEVKEREEGNKGKREEEITVSKDTVCQTDIRLIVEAWNELEAYGIKPVLRLNSGSKRYKSLVARIKAYNVADIFSAIEKIKNSDFLQGKNKQGWTVTFDWFVLPNNFPKVLEGNYDNKSSISDHENSWEKKWRDA